MQNNLVKSSCFEGYSTSKLFKTLKFLIFKILYFLKMCPIFVGSVHNFGRTDGDII